MPEQKHIIWSNIDLDLDDWYDDLHEEYPALGEEGLRDMMYQYNFEYFSDAQSQLDIIPHKLPTVNETGALSATIR